MRIGVELCTYNRASELALLLESLRNQSFQDFDLIIVDDSTNERGPNPTTNYPFVMNLLTRFKLDKKLVKFVYDGQRKAIGAARNLAFKHDPNDVMVRIDDDSVLDSRYLEKLVELYKRLVDDGHKVGAVGGLVPPFGVPGALIDSTGMDIFNAVHFDGQSNKVTVADDGGYLYRPNLVLPSGHLRSSFLFTREAHEAVGGHVEWNGFTGWREETVLTMKMKWAGFELWTDTSAIAWHAKAQTGGGRLPGDAAYQQQVLVEDAFQRWGMREWRKHGEKY